MIYGRKRVSNCRSVCCVFWPSTSMKSVKQFRAFPYLLHEILSISCEKQMFTKTSRNAKKEKERNQFCAIESQKISGSSHRPNRSFAAAHRLPNLYYLMGQMRWDFTDFRYTMKEMLSARPSTSHVELFFWSILGTNQSAAWHGNHGGFHSEEVLSESKKFVRFNGKRMERTTSASQQRIPDITSLLSFSTPVLGAWTLRPNSPQSQQPLYLAAMEFVCSYTNWVFLFFVSLASSRKKTTASASCWWLIIHRTHISTRLRNKWIRINEFWYAHETHKIPPRHTARWHGLLGIQWSTRLYFVVRFVVESSSISCKSRRLETCGSPRVIEPSHRSSMLLNDDKQQSWRFISLVQREKVQNAVAAACDVFLVILRLTHASEPRNKSVKVMSEEHREAKKLGLWARMWEKKDGWVNSEEKKSSSSPPPARPERVNERDSSRSGEERRQ